MRAATLNQVDIYKRDIRAGITHQLPHIKGVEGAGVIEEVDNGECSLTPGQRVLLHPGVACSHCEYCLRGDDVLCTTVRYLGEHRDGTIAEYISVPAKNVFAMPEFMSFTQAAALGVNHLTAWRMLFTKANIQP
jgi:NADPH:quinone reductase-like Zn-dependent oxidoreductase